AERSAAAGGRPGDKPGRGRQAIPRIVRIVRAWGGIRERSTKKQKEMTMELFRHQQEALEETSWPRDGGSALGSMPPGTGRTTAALALAQALDQPTLLLVRSADLVEPTGTGPRCWEQDCVTDGPGRLPPAYRVLLRGLVLGAGTGDHRPARFPPAE